MASTSIFRLSEGFMITGHGVFCPYCEELFTQDALADHLRNDQFCGDEFTCDLQDVFDGSPATPWVLEDWLKERSARSTWQKDARGNKVCPIAVRVTMRLGYNRGYVDGYLHPCGATTATTTQKHTCKKGRSCVWSILSAFDDDIEDNGQYIPRPGAETAPQLEGAPVCVVFHWQGAQSAQPSRRGYLREGKRVETGDDAPLHEAFFDYTTKVKRVIGHTEYDRLVFSKPRGDRERISAGCSVKSAGLLDPVHFSHLSRPDKRRSKKHGGPIVDINVHCPDSQAAAARKIAAEAARHPSKCSTDWSSGIPLVYYEVDMMKEAPLFAGDGCKQSWSIPPVGVTAAALAKYIAGPFAPPRPAAAAAAAAAPAGVGASSSATASVAGASAGVGGKRKYAAAASVESEDDDDDDDEVSDNDVEDTEEYRKIAPLMPEECLDAEKKKQQQQKKAKSEMQPPPSSSSAGSAKMTKGKAAKHTPRAPSAATASSAAAGAKPAAANPASTAKAKLASSPPAPARPSSASSSSSMAVKTMSAKKRMVRSRVVKKQK